MATQTRNQPGSGDKFDPIDRTEYPFTSRWLDLPVGRIHYVDEGAGESLLFVHGTPTWSFEWRHLIRAFAPTHRCLAPDHLGFGLSERPRDFPYMPEAHAANLASFVDRLDPETFTLIVHDFGGPIGLPLCLRQPERVKRLVIVNTWLWSFKGDKAMTRKARLAGSRLGRWLYGWANLSLRVLTPAAYGDKRKLTPEIHRHYLERFPDRWSRQAVLWPLANALLGSSDYYDSLWQQRARLQRRPALIVWGLQDSAFPPEHLAHEEAPEQVIAAIGDFLAGS